MNLLSVDPGLRAVGWALWHDGTLLSAGLVRCAEADRATVVSDVCKGIARGVGQALTDAFGPLNGTDLRKYRIDTLAVEQMRVYSGPQQKGDPNDLIDVAHVAGGVLGFFCCFPDMKASFVAAHAWKGQVPKPIMQRRIEEALTGTEHMLVRSSIQTAPPSLRHNCWDAVGIGLHALGRLR